MYDVVSAVLSTPTGNVLIFSSLVFFFVAVAGRVAGKIDPGTPGRVASAVIGSALLTLGLTLNLGATPPVGAAPPTSPSNSEELSRLRTAIQEAARKTQEAEEIAAKEENARREAEARRDQAERRKDDAERRATDAERSRRETEERMNQAQRRLESAERRSAEAERSLARSIDGSCPATLRRLADARSLKIIGTTVGVNGNLGFATFSASPDYSPAKAAINTSNFLRYRIFQANRRGGEFEGEYVQVITDRGNNDTFSTAIRVDPNAASVRVLFSGDWRDLEDQRCDRGSNGQVLVTGKVAATYFTFVIAP